MLMVMGVAAITEVVHSFCDAELITARFFPMTRSKPFSGNGKLMAREQQIALSKVVTAANESKSEAFFILFVIGVLGRQRL